MSRHFVALAFLALGAILAASEPSTAGVRGGIRAGGAIRPAIIVRNPRAAIPGVPPRAAIPLRATGAPRFGAIRPSIQPHRFARRSVADLHHFRRHHRAIVSGEVYPFTSDGDFSYLGIPYDPAEAIPVYGPPPIADFSDPPPPPPFVAPLAPRASSARDENQDACRSERVTVPAKEGEREITVVRC